MFDYVYFEPLDIVKAHLGINCVIALFAVLAVVLRLVARFTTGAGLWWDDWLILASLPQALGMLIIQGMWLPMGNGYDLPATLPNLETILKMLLAYELIYSVSISTVKISVLLFYLRVFVNRGLRIATKASLAFIVLWSVANILQVFLICRPFAKTYTIGMEGKCGDQIASYISIGVFNIVTDVIIILLPLPTVWSLKMSTPTKLGLTGVFVVGLLVSVIAIIRIYTLTTLDLTNLTGTMVWAAFWSATEPLLAVFCVSLPMLGSLWTRWTGRGIPSSHYASRRTGRTKSMGYPVGSSSDGTSNNVTVMTIGGSGSKEGNSGKFPYHHGGDEEPLNDSDTHIPLQSLYAANRTVHYESAVGTGDSRSDERHYPGSGTALGGHQREKSGQGHHCHQRQQDDKDSGSEVELTAAESRERELDLEAGGIRVQTGWSITRH